MAYGRSEVNKSGLFASTSTMEACLSGSMSSTSLYRTRLRVVIVVILFFGVVPVSADAAIEGLRARLEAGTLDFAGRHADAKATLDRSVRLARANGEAVVRGDELRISFSTYAAEAQAVS